MTSYNLQRSDLPWQVEYISVNILDAAFSKLIFLFVDIFSCDKKYNIIIWGENTVRNRQCI